MYTCRVERAGADENDAEGDSDTTEGHLLDTAARKRKKGYVPLTASFDRICP